MKKNYYKAFIFILCVAVVVISIYCFSLYQINKKLTAENTGGDSSRGNSPENIPSAPQVENTIIQKNSEALLREAILKFKFWVEEKDGWSVIQKLDKITEPVLMHLFELAGVHPDPNFPFKLISESGRRRKTDVLAVVKANDMCVLEGKRGKNLKPAISKQVDKYKATNQTRKSLLLIFYINDIDEKNGKAYLTQNPDEQNRSYTIDVRKQTSPSKLA